MSKAHFQRGVADDHPVLASESHRQTRWKSLLTNSSPLITQGQPHPRIISCQRCCYKSNTNDTPLLEFAQVLSVVQPLYNLTGLMIIKMDATSHISMHNPLSRHLAVRWFNVTGDIGSSKIPPQPCTLSALSSGGSQCATVPLSCRGSYRPLHRGDYHSFGSARTSFAPC